MSRPQPTLLVTLTGRDRPGVTSRLFSGLSAHDLTVLDVEQVVIRGHLVLGVLLACPQSPDLTAIHRRLTSLGADIAVQRGGLHRRAMRLVVMDVDSTLLQDEAIDLLADRAGCAAEVSALTRAAMRGEIEYASGLRRRVELLAGLDAGVLDELTEKLRLTPGARTLVRTLKRLGYRCGVVSGGFTQITDWLTADLGLDYAAANTLEIERGRLTGRVTGELIDRPDKERMLRLFAAEAGVPLSQTVAVGDGANDLDMIAAAGLGIAFNAKPAVRSAADTSVSVPHLDAILYLLGISRDDVEAADD